MNLDSGDAKLVLLCPAWKKFGSARTVKPGTMILHSRADDVVPFIDSEELVKNSGLPSSSLIEIGDDHRLADPEPLEAMLQAFEKTGFTLPCCGATPVHRIKELPHVYGTDFDLFRCAHCGKAWVAAFVSAAPQVVGSRSMI